MVDMSDKMKENFEEIKARIDEHKDDFEDIKKSVGDLTEQAQGRQGRLGDLPCGKGRQEGSRRARRDPPDPLIRRTARACAPAGECMPGESTPAYVRSPLPHIGKGLPYTLGLHACSPLGKVRRAPFCTRL